jgi:hypothetical protein
MMVRLTITSIPSLKKPDGRSNTLLPPPTSIFRNSKLREEEEHSSSRDIHIIRILLKLDSHNVLPKEGIELIQKLVIADEKEIIDDCQFIQTIAK